ncbi:MAG: nicotinate (nicotinamide) nucleotide adenylyltransferase [Candidatus Melainabacteria bacterium GWF2_32_7]|nr:MAG: nicotinate (nicotinamide) nucleotide adenylyltransferase [Candidatus Melainabacteria bacterium GWF2_32_7]
MNLTVFSGTFNPIHIAHLIIAETVKDELGLDKVTFIPAFCPPHRDRELANPDHRLNMVKIAIQDNPSFEISDIEFKRQEKSYTYLTIQDLFKKNPQISGKINFIIGSDAFKLIDTWYEAEKLAELLNFIIVIRPDNTEIGKLFENIKLKQFDFEIVKTPLLDISSSDIRRRIKKKKSIKYLVPRAVEEYIYDNNLYIQ